MVWTVEELNYHDDASAYSNSMLRFFENEGPEAFYGRYISKTMPKKQSSPEQVFGSVVHCLALEPAEFDSRYFVMPNLDLRRKADQKKKADLEEKNPGKEAIKEADCDRAAEAVSAIHGSKDAKMLLETVGVVEKAVYWNDNTTGLPCKCKPDKLILDDFFLGSVVVEIKTTHEIPNLANVRHSVRKWKYDCQAAHYLAGTGADIHRTIFVRSLYPFQVTVWEYGLAKSAWEQNEKTLRKIHQCIKSNDWRLSESRQINKLEETNNDYEF